MIKYQVMEFEISGIKCDNQLCDYDNPNVSLYDYKHWLNKPCPKCGSNLLTEKDYNAVVAMVNFMHRVNKWSNKLLPEFILKWLTKKKKCVDVSMNGTGKVEIKRDASHDR